ncbi:acyltransferase family protein [Aliihoeflea sp. PC F10.4]
MQSVDQGIGAGRVGWVDAAKGICIIFVVMMHSTLGVGVAMDGQGWLHAVVEFARPFRMPDFFLISGLFLGLVIDRPWMRYLDRKVVHFAYFYVLWLTIQFAFKAPGMAMEDGVAGTAQHYLISFVEPFGTLWFIYILPIFFLVTRLMKSVPIVLVFAAAAALEILPIKTGWMLADEFASRYVYFFAGYAFATNIFRIASWLQARPLAALAILAVWAPINGWLVFTHAPAYLMHLVTAELGETGATNGLSELPFISLALGFAGALAVVAVAALIAERPWSRWLSWLGAHSIVIYLAFFLPMAVSRAILMRTGLDIGTMSALVTVAGIAGPVVLYGLIQWTGYGRFLFERPDWAHIDRPRVTERPIVPAE